ncbi:MAG: hypothetical protein ACLUHA_13780 [Bacteroides stercoris]
MANQQQELVYILWPVSAHQKAKYLIWESNLLENILNTADTCIVKKENSVTLRFGLGESRLGFLRYACWNRVIVLIRLPI